MEESLDLVFPHHENEIAQSESASNCKPFAKIWMHNGLLKRSGDEKMSKSLGNSLDVKDALEKYSGNSIRLWILQSHYRQPSSLDDTSLEIAQKSITRIERTINLDGNSGFDTKNYKEKFIEAMNDDLGTPKAIATIFDLVHDINKSNDSSKKINEGVVLLKELLSVLGFEFLKEIQDDSEIIKLIDKRNQLKGNKEYDKADQIRNDLLSMGIEILDSKEGTNFRRI